MAKMTSVGTHNKTCERDQSMVICSKLGWIDTEEFASREWGLVSRRRIGHLFLSRGLHCSSPLCTLSQTIVPVGLAH